MEVELIECYIFVDKNVADWLSDYVLYFRSLTLFFLMFMYLHCLLIEDFNRSSLYAFILSHTCNWKRKTEACQVSESVYYWLNVGELYTWGRDEGEGRLGLGPGRGPNEGGGLSIPSEVKALTMPMAAVSCGGFFTMVLTEKGQLWNWGGKVVHSFV